ncbi:MAG: L-serine ammonia-lyase, iron-sulfur-dependent, subunit alpha [Candidatus Aminicenantaceae bacterium]
MDKISILNDVLGPIMRGPSSSHTAGSFRIGRMVRSLWGDDPCEFALTFDPGGSYAQVYREQAVDLAFAAGFLGWPITDERFSQALETARSEGRGLSFAVRQLGRADHPNFVHITLTSPQGRSLEVEARSTGGGGIQLTRFQDWPVCLDGKRFVYVMECDAEQADRISALVSDPHKRRGSVEKQRQDDRVLMLLSSDAEWEPDVLKDVQNAAGPRSMFQCPPVFHVTPGEPVFANASEMVSLSEGRGLSLGRLALEHEAQLLGISQEEVLAEMKKRLGIMRRSVEQGLRHEDIRMQLLLPTAGNIFRAEQEGRLAVGGMHTRAAARAMAVMHVCNSQGVVCAAPTGGAAGVIPGVVVSLLEEQGRTEEAAVLGLLAASAVGVIVAARATFAAEIAGCQVEIGAAGAMAAALVVEMSGGSARQAADAAAISFQNTMGSVCDLVQGMCEIPCHTRNAAASSGAFVCADLILGGYINPVPLDETIDAVLSSGRMLPSELRVTSKGGLALAPSAKALPRQR